MRWLSLLIGILAACGDDPAPVIRARWTHPLDAAAAPPALGPESRVLALLSEIGSNGGAFVGLEQANGGVVDGPHEGLPLSPEAPLSLGTSVVFGTSIGKVQSITLGGALGFSSPDSGTYGKLTEPVAAADGSIRVATTGGDVIALAADGAERWKTHLPSGGAVSTRPAVTGGRTYVATDLGDLIGVDDDGGITFQATVHAPASGPAVAADGKVAVGELDGVRIFSPDGAELGRRPRGARVVGVIAVAGGFVAYGEDGLVERIDSTGGLVFSAASAASAPPPVSARPIALEGDRLGFIDDAGTAHLVGPDGAELSTLALGAPIRGSPTPLGDNGFVYVASGKDIRAIDFLGE